MRMLQDVPAEELAKALDKGMLRNTPPTSSRSWACACCAFARQLIRAAGSVRKGDVIDLDHDPARGTLVSINGKLQGPAILGEDFYAALLRSFVGERPYDRRLKAGCSAAWVPERGPCLGRCASACRLPDLWRCRDAIPPLETDLMQRSRLTLLIGAAALALRRWRCRPRPIPASRCG
jgi:hypothetical protein